MSSLLHHSYCSSSSPLTSRSSLKLNFLPSSRIPASQNAVVSKAALFPPLTFLFIHSFIYKITHSQFLFEKFSYFRDVIWWSRWSTRTESRTLHISAAALLLTKQQQQQQQQQQRLPFRIRRMHTTPGSVYFPAPPIPLSLRSIFIFSFHSSF